MKIHRLWTFAVALTVAQLLGSRTVVSQRLPTSTRLISTEVAFAASNTTESIGEPRLAWAYPDTALALRPYTLRADTTAPLKRRVLPYYVIGAAFGGAVGYAVMPKGCDASENMFCGYSLAAYPIGGAAIGGLIGIIVGYTRERR